MVRAVGSDDEFFALIKRPETSTLVDFTATWCGPCQRIKPTFHALAEQHQIPDLFEFVTVDVDDLADSAAHAGIRAMPTFQVWKNGEKVQEIVGGSTQGLTELVQRIAADYKVKLEGRIELAV